MRPLAAAYHIGVSPSTIERAMRDGSLPYRMVGDARVIAAEDLEKWFLSLPVQRGRLPGRGIHKK